MASNSGWSYSIPSGTSLISDGDDEIRAFKTHMENWWEGEHFATGGSANSAGVHRIGSARAYSMTATSQLSNPTGDGDARLAWVSANNSLWVADASNSTWTQVSAFITLATANTWTALNTFSSDISVSDIDVGGSWAGVLSGSTVSHLVSIGASGVLNFPITVTGARPGDFCIVSCTSGRAEAGAAQPAFQSNCTANDLVEVTIVNNTASTWSLASEATISVIVLGNPDRA